MLFRSINYLVNTHGIKSVQSLFNENLDSLTNGKEDSYYYSRYMQSNTVTDLLNKKYLSELSEDTQSAFTAPPVTNAVKRLITYTIVEKSKNIYNIKEYDYAIHIDNTGYNINDRNFSENFILDPDKSIMLKGGNSITVGSLNFIDDAGNKCSFDLNELINKLKPGGRGVTQSYDSYLKSYPKERLFIRQETPKLNMAVQIESIQTYETDSTSELNNINGMVFIRFK